MVNLIKVFLFFISVEKGELHNEKIRINIGVHLLQLSKLFRIKALIDFADVKADNLGGFIEKEANLDMEDNAWVCGKAKVCDNAEICSNARVGDDKKERERVDIL